MKYLRWLLFPFALVYGLVVIIRNALFNAGTFKSRSFELPVISVGNLDVGGAGKTPMTEYLIRLLKSDYKLATLSRGYGRKTQGFIEADAQSTASQIGDEPAQMKRKFLDITVSVCEDRVTGIERLQTDHNLILMDDAYQHRAVKPGLSLLLFDYRRLTEVNLMLPAGDRREPFSGRKRADIIVVTKCPANLNESDRERIRLRLALYPHQQLFFSTIQYLPLEDRTGNAAAINIDADTTVFLLTGIAGTQPLIKHLSGLTSHIIHHKYADHHPYTPKNIAKLAAEFDACNAQKKLIITTEKDAQRLGEQELLPLVNKLPVYVLPIGVGFLNDAQPQFNHLITTYVRKHSTHHRIH